MSHIHSKPSSRLPSLKMSRFLALAAILALAAAVPYPPDVAVSVAAPAESPFFGNKDGDFQPSKTIPEAGSPHVLAQGGVVTAGAQTDSINNQDGIGDGVDQYITYSGDGSQGAGWPTEQQWVSFENMFNNSKYSGCYFEILYLRRHRQGHHVQLLQRRRRSQRLRPRSRCYLRCHSGRCLKRQKLTTVSFWLPSSRRLSYAIWLRRRWSLTINPGDGCVRVHTTNYGVRNPGLMQDHNGVRLCCAHKVNH